LTQQRIHKISPYEKKHARGLDFGVCGIVDLWSLLKPYCSGEQSLEQITFPIFMLKIKKLKIAVISPNSDYEFFKKNIFWVWL
jgi:hypothetical protein